MPIHSEGDIPERLRDSDVLIVGAGAVGIAMAVWLTRQGQAVTVLEGGPPTPPADYEDANDGPVVGRPHSGIRNGRMKALGGTTRLWGGQLVPFDRGDLEKTDDSGRPFWPLSYGEFSSWVAEAYDILGVPLAARQTDRLWSRATGSDPEFGNGLAAHMNIWLPVPDFTALFADDLAGPGGPDIVTGAQVQSLVFDAAGRVASVEVSLGTGDLRTVRAKEVILANGTMEISRLLLRSAAVQENCPFAANPHLGRWYLDHLHGIIGELHDADESELQRLFDNVYLGGRKFNVKLRLATDQRPHGLNMAATLNPRLTPRELAAETATLARRVLSGGSPLAAVRQGVAMARIMVPLAWRYLVRRRLTGLFASGTAIGIELEQTPNFDSRLFLDPDQPPETARIGIDWRLSGREIEAAADLADRVKASLERRGLGRVEIEPRIAARDPAALLQFTDSAHQMGGARMAVSADDGVTDPQCRVHGSPNLSIAGAAVFPSGSFANCTLSAIAIALRTAQRVKTQVADTDRASAREEPGELLIDSLVFGCARLTGGASEKTSLALLARAFDAGVRAVDVAPSYGMGTAETVVGKAVARAAAEGRDIAVYAKLGSHRDTRGYAKTWLRAAKRLVRPTPPRNLADWTPAAVRDPDPEDIPTPAALKESHAVALARLGRIDALMLHDIPPQAAGTEVVQTMRELAERTSARAGYAISWPPDPAADAEQFNGLLMEAAIDPALLAGLPTSAPAADLLHSIIPTMNHCTRCDARFDPALEAAAGLIELGDPETRRIAATYALGKARAPHAKLIYGSNDPVRLGSFLAAIREIDRRNLVGKIAAKFDR